MARAEHALPRLKHQFSRDVGRMPARQRFGEFVADGGEQWLQAVLCKGKQIKLKLVVCYRMNRNDMHLGWTVAPGVCL